MYIKKIATVIFSLFFVKLYYTFLSFLFTKSGLQVQAFVRMTFCPNVLFIKDKKIADSHLPEGSCEGVRVLKKIVFFSIAGKQWTFITLIK